VAQDTPGQGKCRNDPESHQVLEKEESQWVLAEVGEEGGHPVLDEAGLDEVADGKDPVHVLAAAGTLAARVVGMADALWKMMVIKNSLFTSVIHRMLILVLSI
jgi:hypothetical protein